MPTYTQLQQEPAWNAEYAPPNLQAFYTGLRTYLGVGTNAVGGKGDNKHLRGYHRSRRWILESRYSAYGRDDYSITNALDKGGDPNWLAALDATPKTTATLVAMCQRLDAAMRADTLPQVREWYGNVDGNQVVDGWDDVIHRAASSDSSHLWHLHISFYRSRANDDHSNLLAVLTQQGGDDMETFVITDGSGAAGVWYETLGVHEMAQNGDQIARWQRESGRPELKISRAEYDAGRVGVPMAALRALIGKTGNPGGLVDHTHDIGPGTTGPAKAG